MVSVYLPKNIFFLIIDYFGKRKLIIYNSKKYLFISSKDFKFFKTSRILVIGSYKLNIILNNTNFFINYIYTWNTFFIKKIKFKGKGYKIIKKKNFLFLTFNKSHITWFIFFKIICLRIAKQKCIFIWKNNIRLSQTLSNLKSIKPINTYTKRGIRIGRQKIFKKIGKRTA